VNFKFKNKKTTSAVNNVHMHDSAGPSSSSTAKPNTIQSNEDYAMLLDMIKKVKTQSKEHSINRLTHSTTAPNDNKRNSISNSF
jgi:hypothetical protein